MTCPICERERDMCLCPLPLLEKSAKVEGNMSETPGKYKEIDENAEKCAHCNKEIPMDVLHVLTISTYRDGKDDHFSILMCKDCLNRILTKVFRIPEKKPKEKSCPKPKRRKNS